MKSTMKFVCVASGAALALGFGAANASAAPEVERTYSLKVPKNNGKTCTAEVPKVVEDLSGDIRSRGVSGGYTVDAGMAASCGTFGVGWVRVKTSTNAKLSNSFASGSGVLLIMSNDLTTPDDVYATGQWDAH